MNIIDVKHQDAVKSTAKVLFDGGIIIFPTDTVYGIGCALYLNNDLSKFNHRGIKKLYKIKNRSITKPTALLFSKKTVSYLRSSVFRGTVEGVIKKYLKGKVTVVVGVNKFKIKFPKVLIKNNKIGFRIPDDLFLQKLINLVGPIVASSANLAGERTPKKFSDINSKLLEQADLIVKSDQISSNLPSTVYDLEENKIIRQ